MTQPKDRDPDTLYVTDAELIRRSGVPERIMRMRLKALDDDRNSGFPKKQKLWGNRRYWPAVRAWFDAHSRPAAPDPRAARDLRTEPKLSRDGKFLMTPEQHRKQAQQLRAHGTPKALGLASQHENLAKVIERRQSRD